MNNISLILAFSAGLLSFLSPCVLPLVPAYISYITGTSINDFKSKKSNLYVLYKSIGFIIGFSIIFIIMGASITSIGKAFIKNQSIFRRASGILIFIFGLHTTGIFKIKLFYREKRFLSFKNTSGAFSSVLMGMAFAAGWTPCVGPILSSILVYASSMETISRGITLLVFYSLGLAVPFILTALAIENLSSKMSRLGKYLNFISIVSGILMLLMGILIFTNKISILSQYFNVINF
ncbi:cytochrome c biogenesis CcdA family protein [Clostridium peptidivorans]|uniref:cytochrome c biogenesis CcdA family protein n=1 Tax=Clostridium peptidivorans TaxID=100174 RepID=UPI000BE221F6|nr:cytochrome c biogenesis protein CcdA [Clostridium peptidivorans]